MRRYVCIFEAKSEEYDVDKNLLISIAILENINRPAWVRMLERISQRVTRRAYTVGLMQVNSVKHMSNEQSIDLAAQMLSNYNTSNPLKVGELYNGSREYGKCLKYVMSQVQKF